VTLVAVRVAVKMGEFVLSTKRILIVVIAALATMLTTLSVPAQAASAPGKPVAKISSGNARVVLSWVASASNGSTITAYQVGARKYAAGKWQAWSYYNLSRTSRSKSVAYRNGTKVQAKVRAKNAKGFGAWSLLRSTVVGLPGVPSGGSVRQGDQSLIFSWNAPSGNGSPITGYRVFYRVNLGGVWGNWASTTTSSAIRTRSFQSLRPTSTYQFSVLANNKWGSGGRSQSSSAVVIAKPAAPTLVSGVGGASEATLSWRPNIGEVRALAVGNSHACALSSTGAVSCWQNNPGQTPISTPFDNGLTPSRSVKSISAGDDHTCALLSVGTVECWGGRSAEWDLSGLSGVRSISSGRDSACAILDDGVRCWGASLVPRGSPPFVWDEIMRTTPLVEFYEPGTDVKSVSSGNLFKCALLNIGTVKCWGLNDVGQLGNGSKSSYFGPVQVPGLRDVISMSSGRAHTCAVIKTGAVKCWGAGADGQLGAATSSNAVEPVDVPGLTSNVRSVAAGGSHTCALLFDGSVKCLGANQDGELGNGSIISTAVPSAVSGLGGVATAISSGRGQTCALLFSTKVKCWGGVPSGTILTPASSTFLTGVSSIVAADLHTCALLATSQVECWGAPFYGDLSGGVRTSPTPVKIAELGNDVAAISAGGYTTCVLLISGPVKCWGDNNSGQVGGGWQSGEPVLIPNGVVGLDGGVGQISVGTFHACALLNTGGVKCWGAFSGVWGVSSAIPVDISGLSGVSAISAGGGHTCALLEAGNVKCWGANFTGQLGDGSTSPSITPVDVSGLSGVSAISAGGMHTCALLEAGNVKCWGSNFKTQGGIDTGVGGQLGIGLPLYYSSAPVDVVALSRVAQITAGPGHTCAILIEGTIKCWGDNYTAQLGLTPIARPVQIRGLPIMSTATSTYTVTSLQEPSKSCTATAPALECTIVNLNPGQTYNFQVKATNSVGTSDPSTPSQSITIS
jgi:alpha-tubulin suppressor-like RCC1 family protein